MKSPEGTPSQGQDGPENPKRRRLLKGVLGLVGFGALTERKAEASTKIGFSNQTGETIVIIENGHGKIGRTTLRPGQVSSKRIFATQPQGRFNRMDFFVLEPTGRKPIENPPPEFTEWLLKNDIRFAGRSEREMPEIIRGIINISKDEEAALRALVEPYKKSLKGRKVLGRDSERSSEGLLDQIDGWQKIVKRVGDREGAREIPIGNLQEWVPGAGQESSISIDFVQEPDGRIKVVRKWN